MVQSESKQLTTSFLYMVRMTANDNLNYLMRQRDGK